LQDQISLSSNKTELSDPDATDSERTYHNMALTDAKNVNNSTKIKIKKCIYNEQKIGTIIRFRQINSGKLLGKTGLEMNE